METSTGRKDDAEKPRFDLIQFRALAAVVRVLTFGARKYAPDNWRLVPEPKRRYYAAALRHLTDWWLGQRLDPQSGEPHLAHAICCLNFLLEIEEESLDPPRAGLTPCSVPITAEFPLYNHSRSDGPHDPCPICQAVLDARK